MRLIALCVPLLLSTTAFAQATSDQGATTPNPSRTLASAPGSLTPVPGTTALVPVPDSTVPGGYRIEKITTAASGKVIHPDNLNPQRDNSGVVVISDPAVVPEGWNSVTESAAVGGPLEDTVNVDTVPTVGGVPRCSALITDHCMETYRQDFTGQ